MAMLAAVYTSLTERAREALWAGVPDAAGWAEPPAWYVLARSGRSHSRRARAGGARGCGEDAVILGP